MSVLSFFKRKPDLPPAPMEQTQNWASPVASLEDAVRRKRLTSRLAANANNAGNLLLDGGLQVMGSHEGTLVVTDERGIVWISENGVVKGDIEAPQVYVLGTVLGSVRADLVMIEGGGRIEGEIWANRMHLRNVRDVGLVARIRQRDAQPVVEQGMPGAIVPISSASM